MKDYNPFGRRKLLTRLLRRFLRRSRFLSFLRYDIPRMFRNLWAFRNTIVGGYYWDSSFLYMAMRDAITAQRKVLLTGNSVNAPKHVRDMDIALHILDRIIEDEYDTRKFDFHDEGTGFPGWSMTVKENTPLSKKAVMEIEASNKKHAMQLLAKILAQNSPTWWD